jgi:hypothetical protein
VSIVKVRPEDFTFTDELLDCMILEALDRAGKELLDRRSGSGASPTTTRVALAISQYVVEHDYRQSEKERVADGLVVTVGRVGDRLRKLERQGKVRAVRLPSKREARWWHIDWWNERDARHAQHDREVAARQAEMQALRERWQALGFEPRTIESSEVIFDREIADRLLARLEG